MKHLPRFLAMVVVAVAVFTFTSVHPAFADHATGLSIVSVVCNSDTKTVTVIVTNIGGTGDTSAIYEQNTGRDFPAQELLIGASATLTLSDSSFTSGHTVEVRNGSSDLLGGVIDDVVATCTSSQTVTWCNLSGDGRVNGLCGDRIAVYCNAKQTPPNIDVWVIDSSSVGHELAKINLSDLTSVAEGKFVKNLGANGVIFAGSDANGNGYAALQGGPYSGTASGDWLKTFSCKAS